MNYTKKETYWDSFKTVLGWNSKRNPVRLSKKYPLNKILWKPVMPWRSLRWNFGRNLIEDSGRKTKKTCARKFLKDFFFEGLLIFFIEFIHEFFPKFHPEVFPVCSYNSFRNFFDVHWSFFQSSLHDFLISLTRGLCRSTSRDIYIVLPGWLLFGNPSKFFFLEFYNGFLEWFLRDFCMNYPGISFRGFTVPSGFSF